jgi:REP element-mobilizing transposase RayT
MTIHLVFSTKYRQPFILPQIENDLYGFLSNLCEELECPSIQIGGYYDHVHVICFLSRKIAVMKLAARMSCRRMCKHECRKQRKSSTI